MPYFKNRNCEFAKILIFQGLTPPLNKALGVSKVETGEFKER